VQPREFLQRAHAKMGDVFTVNLFGWSMTFLMSSDGEERTRAVVVIHSHTCPHAQSPSCTHLYPCTPPHMHTHAPTTTCENKSTQTRARQSSSAATNFDQACTWPTRHHTVTFSPTRLLLGQRDTTPSPSLPHVDCLANATPHRHLLSHTLTAWPTRHHAVTFTPTRGPRT
jgi:hypothetical protein